MSFHDLENHEAFFFLNQAYTYTLHVVCFFTYFGSLETAIIFCFESVFGEFGLNIFIMKIKIDENLVRV